MESKPRTWWVYMVRCQDDSLYTGIAVDVEKRFREHRENGPRGAKYLRGRGPLELVFKQKIGGKGLALKVERQVKKLPKAKKEVMIIDPSVIRGILERVNMDRHKESK